MTQAIDEKGRLQLPPNFKPGETVDVHIAGDNALMIFKPSESVGREIKRVTLPDGYSVIVGLPPIDTEGVKRLLEDCP